MQADISSTSCKLQVATSSASYKLQASISSASYKLQAAMSSAPKIWNKFIMKERKQRFLTRDVCLSNFKIKLLQKNVYYFACMIGVIM